MQPRKKQKKELTDYRPALTLAKDRQKGYTQKQLNLLGYIEHRSHTFADHRKNNADWFFITKKEIAEATGISRSNIDVIINKFLVDGLIAYSSGWNPDGKNTASSWKLLYNYKPVDIYSTEGKQDIKNSTIKDIENQCFNNKNSTIKNSTIDEKQYISIKNIELRIKNKEIRIKNLNLEFLEKLEKLKLEGVEEMEIVILPSLDSFEGEKLEGTELEKTTSTGATENGTTLTDGVVDFLETFGDGDGEEEGDWFAALTTSTDSSAGETMEGEEKETTHQNSPDGVLNSNSSSLFSNLNSCTSMRTEEEYHISKGSLSPKTHISQNSNIVVTAPAPPAIEADPWETFNQWEKQPQKQTISTTKPTAAVTYAFSAQTPENNNKNTLTMETPKQHTTARTMETMINDLQSVAPSSYEEKGEFRKKIYSALKQSHNEEQHGIIVKLARRGFSNDERGEGLYNDFVAKNPYRPQSNWKERFEEVETKINEILTATPAEVENAVKMAKNAVVEMGDIYHNPENFKRFREEKFRKIKSFEAKARAGVGVGEDFARGLESLLVATDTISANNAINICCKPQCIKKLGIAHVIQTTINVLCENKYLSDEKKEGIRNYIFTKINNPNT